MNYGKYLSLILVSIILWHLSYWVKSKARKSLKARQNSKNLAENKISLLLEQNAQNSIVIGKLKKQLDDLENAVRNRLY